MDGDAERFVINCACNGSQQAWCRLFEWHFDALYRLCMVLTDGRQDLAEEVSQQTFVTAARHICRFRPEQATFRAWLHGIARNRCLTLDAKEQRRRRHEMRPQREDGSPARSFTPNALVHEVLARLPFEYRRVLEDKYLRKQTMKEMAETSGKSVEAIESLLRKARDRFAPLYESMQNDH